MVLQYKGHGREIVDLDGSLILLLHGSVLRTRDDVAHSSADIRRLIEGGQLVPVKEDDSAQH